MGCCAGSMTARGTKCIPVGTASGTSPMHTLPIKNEGCFSPKL